MVQASFHRSQYNSISANADESPEPICRTSLKFVFSRLLNQVTKKKRLLLSREESGITTAVLAILQLSKKVKQQQSPFFH